MPPARDEAGGTVALDIETSGPAEGERQISVMIELNSVTKRFGPILAVDDVSFSTSKGEVLGFLGPNGSGKSTTMKMITGYLTPTAGQIRVCGFDVNDHPIEAKRRIGYLPEGAPAYSDMTPVAYLRFIGEVHGFRGAELRRRVENVVDLTALGGVLRQPIDTLSKGFKRRVGVAQALLHDPEVLIMDEPTDGLDPNQKHEVRNLIKRMAAAKTIILSTHILEEVDAVCTRAIVIAKGRLVASGTPAELESRSRFHNAVTVKFGSSASLSAAQAAIAALTDVGKVEALGANGLIIFPREGHSIIAEVSRLSRANSWEVEEFFVEHGRLDDVFRTITTGRAAASQ